MTENSPYQPSAREIFEADYRVAEIEARDAVRILECEQGHREIGFYSASLDGIAAQWTPFTVEHLEAVARRMLDLAAKMRAGAL